MEKGHQHIWDFLKGKQNEPQHPETEILISNYLNPAYHILFSNYPQTILHEFGDGTRIIQIVYLVVNCSPNSNFSELYASVGRAVDLAIGNTDNIYESYIKKSKSLGAKADAVARLIERFSVGIIIFDEIQLIDITGTKENSVLPTVITS